MKIKTRLKCLKDNVRIFPMILMADHLKGLDRMVLADPVQMDLAGHDKTSVMILTLIFQVVRQRVCHQDFVFALHKDRHQTFQMEC
jgi:hypothetical protein